MSTPFDLDRFQRAQARGDYNRALGEIRVGAKRSHWIWYIFPQLSGLGGSPQAITFGLDGVAEAVAYLRDPVLRERLAIITHAAAKHLEGPRPLPLVELMGSQIDALKLLSSMTLFAEVAARLNAREPSLEAASLAHDAAQILAVGVAQGFPACRFTRASLGGVSWDEALLPPG